jgi:serine phosphatase RsbU (regulator of sigma subunit)
MDEGGALYGRARTLAAVSGQSGAPGSKIVERLLNSVREFEAGAEASDDLTVMAVRFLG